MPDAPTFSIRMLMHDGTTHYAHEDDEDAARIRFRILTRQARSAVKSIELRRRDAAGEYTQLDYKEGSWRA